MDKLKGCLKSKTQWFALALAVLGAVQGAMGVFSQVLTPQAFGWFTLMIGVGVAVLRWITTTDLGEK